MISKKILALPIIVIIGIAVVFISISLSEDDAVRSLTFGDKIIDLGIQRVDDDYNVKSEIKFKNKNKTKVAILGMNKPCVCQTVEITPNDSGIIKGVRPQFLQSMVNSIKYLTNTKQHGIIPSQLRTKQHQKQGELQTMPTQRTIACRRCASINITPRFRGCVAIVPFSTLRSRSLMLAML